MTRTKQARIDALMDDNVEMRRELHDLRRLTYCRLTADDLRDLGACREQVGLFARLYPRGVTCPDAAAVLAATRAGLDVGWLVCALAPRPLRAEYERQHAALWAEHERQYAALLAEYERQHAALWADLLAVVWPVEDVP